MNKAFILCPLIFVYGLKVTFKPKTVRNFHPGGFECSKIYQKKITDTLGRNFILIPHDKGVTLSLDIPTSQIDKKHSVTHILSARWQA